MQQEEFPHTRKYQKRIRLTHVSNIIIKEM